MSFGSFDSGGTAQPMAEINTTPLVDVMLVLLVIFIITAPLLNQAVPVDLPKVSAAPVEQKPSVLNLALDANGSLFLDGQAVHRAVVEQRLQQALADRGDSLELHLRADRGTRYEKVADIMAAAQRVGIAKIAFVTEAPTP
ncbi:MAG TPA: biopolymer transporter ExbD [Azospira sp.]|nr:biopolymer transporter ExbD [Azospira sp.]